MPVVVYDYNNMMVNRTVDILFAFAICLVVSIRCRNKLGTRLESNVLLVFIYAVESAVLGIATDYVEVMLFSYAVYLLFNVVFFRCVYHLRLSGALLLAGIITVGSLACDALAYSLASRPQMPAQAAYLFVPACRVASRILLTGLLTLLIKLPVMQPKRRACFKRHLGAAGAVILAGFAADLVLLATVPMLVPHIGLVYIFSSAVLIVLLMIAGAFIALSVWVDQMHRKLRTYETQIDRQEVDNQSLRRDRHEYINNLGLIRLLCDEEGAVEKIKEYTNRFIHENDVLAEIEGHGSYQTGSALVDGLLWQYSMSAGRRGVRMEVDVESPPEGIPEEILYLALTNLLNNALEVMENAEMDRLPVISVLFYYEDGGYCVSVSNNGPRIPFDPPSLVLEEGVTTKRSGESHGYGLSNVRRAIQEIGGNIYITSEEQCTEMRILFPAPEEEEQGSRDVDVLQI